MNAMRVVCAWCTRVLEEARESGRATPISHGICEECLVEVMDRRPADLQSFLDRMDVPVLLVDGAGLMRGANIAAQRALGKSMPAITGLPGGDVMECAHARLPGGCGNTVHCAACTLRGTVTQTHRTGQAQVGVQATMELVREGTTARTLISFTTERVGGVVWLRLEGSESPGATP